MTRTVATVTISAIVLTIVVAFLTGVIGIYSAQNTGVTFGDYGIELVGPAGPGFFHCDGQC
jgi:hypothetical protein